MRQFLLLGLPFLLSVALYLAWFLRASRAAQAAGHPTPKLGDVPWPWLALIAVLLLAGALGAFMTMGGATRGGHYEPPHVVDGKVVPGKVAK